MSEFNFLEKCALQEVGDAETFAHLFENKAIFDHNEGEWYIFNGHVWQRDKYAHVLNLVELVAKNYEVALRESGINPLDDPKKYRFYTARINSLRERAGINNALKLATAKMPFTEDWDEQPYLLPVVNGVINLKTGELDASKPEDYLKTCTNVEYQGLDTECPRFMQFLDEIFAGNQEIIDFVQRLFGYALTGLAVEHVLPVFYGEEGRNGKDTLLKTVHHILGDEFCSPMSKEVMLSGAKNPGASAPFLFELIGKRLVYVDETSEGAVLDEGQVKMLTGGAPFIAKKLYYQPVTVYPKYLILVITNSKPDIIADDPAIWERIAVIGFNQRFIDNPQYDHEHKADKFLEYKLQDEYSGILAWMVKGCLEWQKRGGLDLPESVKLETKDYKQEQSLLDTFIDKECILDEFQDIQVSKFYSAIRDYFDDRKIKNRDIGEAMKKRGFEKKRRSDGYYYLGIGLQPTDAEQFNALIEYNLKQQ